MVTDTMAERGVATGQRSVDAPVDPRHLLTWSAIIAGTVAALGVQTILTLLGVGIGAALVNPLSDPGATDGPGAGAIAWLILSGLISFGIGGFVAGSMSRAPRDSGGALHGMLAWALAAVVGTTVTALAGSATLGGAAAGAGAAAGPGIGAVTQRADTSPAGTPAPGAGDTANTANAPNSPAARAAAERAAALAAKAALWTGAAFLLSMGAASAGGALGRRGQARLFPPSASHYE